MRFKKIIPLLVVAAVFSLMLHRVNYGLKLFDVFIFAAGALAFLSDDLRKSFKKEWPKISGYAWLLALLILFIIVGQFAGRAGVFSRDALVNYARVIFNGAVFLFLAFLVSADEKLLGRVSAAAFVSPVVLLPAYWNYAQGVFISGSRLMGYVMTAIILGMYLAVIYIVGLGLILGVKKLWHKLFIFLWLTVIANFILWAASRASWFGILISLAIWLYFLFKEKEYGAIKLLVPVVCFSFLFGFMLLPHSELTMRQWVGERAVTAITNPLKNQAQTQSWRQTANTIPANPLGVGFVHQSPNNILIEIGQVGGVGALIVALLFFGKILSAIKKSSVSLAEGAARTAGQIDMLKTAWLLAAIALLVDAFFTDGFLLRHVWAVLGISAGAALLAEKQKSRAENGAT